ncbi:DUF4349 domain-containing protein [Flavobacterium sp. UMI-01]|uniref:DUF4349 domain-containing protein n=1 Tax=Flavobacterium sp. UMI-01 TaxID=1441053 RepID=UPI001C7CD765|nr:DUF4349 domain-containing protein [Flavobacterium sp. UMI-01]GIZ08108.1 hypothetical protein FUMI01_08350 [Flavobacterium sp. UMI-01]
MKSTLLSFILLFTIVSCKKAEENTLGVNSLEMAAPSSEADTETVATAKIKKTVETNTSEIQQKIVKTGNLRFETKDLNDTYNQIIKYTKELGGIIQNDNGGKNDETVYRNLIVRIPSQNFDAFIQNISKGVSYFDHKEIAAEDVTAQYIDIDTRIKAKKTLENRYLELLKKANKVSEILEIEAQLAAIREEIEAKQGQLNYLKNQISLSTINIEFYKPIAHESGATVSYGAKIWNAIKSGFNTFSTFLLSLLSIWPFVLLFGLLGYFIYKRFLKNN